MNIERVVGVVLTTVGLVLDILGACVLVRAVILNKETARKMAGTKWNFNADLEKALLQQSSEAKRGLSLLVFGFILQIIGAWFGSPILSPPNSCP